MVLMVPLLIMASSLVSKINTRVALVKGWVNSSLAFMGQLYIGFYSAEQSSIKSIGPGMIAALDGTFKMSELLVAYTRASMAADVEESIKHVISVAHDYDAFSSDSDDLIRAWIRQCISAAHIEPHRAKDLFLLLCENSGIIIVATRKGREKRGVGMDG